MKKWIYTSLIAATLLALTQVTQIHWVKSKSLGDHKLYLTVKGLPVNPGDFVTIYHDTQHLGEAYYTKELAAKEGTDIYLVKGKVFVGINVLPLKYEYKKGFITYELRALEEREIPKGYIFVRGYNENSYDSRYEGFGLVPTSSIVGRSFVLL